MPRASNACPLALVPRTCLCHATVQDVFPHLPCHYSFAGWEKLCCRRAVRHSWQPLSCSLDEAVHVVVTCVFGKRTFWLHGIAMFSVLSGAARCATLFVPFDVCKGIVPPLLLLPRDIWFGESCLRASFFVNSSFTQGTFCLCEVFFFFSYVLFKCATSKEDVTFFFLLPFTKRNIKLFCEVTQLEPQTCWKCWVWELGEV